MKNLIGCLFLFLVPVLSQSQCTAFLGADKVVSVCAGKAVNLTEVFSNGNIAQAWSSDWPTAETTPGEYTLTATEYFFGCTDVAKVTIVNFTKPAIGPDKTIYVCPGTFTDLTLLYNTTGLATTWSAPDPNNAGKGIYRLIVTNVQGCKDTAFVEIFNKYVPDLGKDKAFCVGFDVGEGDLTTLIGVSTAGLTMNWGTFTPATAPAGMYHITGTTGGGCTGSVNIELVAAVKPSLGDNHVIEICTSEFTNLNESFNFTNLSPTWDCPDPESAPPGLYHVIALDIATGCTDTAAVEVVALPGSGLRDTSIIACSGKTFDLTTVYPYQEIFPTFEWQTETPTAVKDGIYQLLVVDNDGCTAMLTATISTSEPTENGILTFTTYDTVRTPVFTTNHFRTILADKFGNVYAGAQNGGLYMYDGVKWTKSAVHAQNTYKDLIEVQDDGGPLTEKRTTVYATSIGYDGLNAYTGGVDKIFSYLPKIIDHSGGYGHYFGSWYYLMSGGLGTVTDSAGGLSSRYGNSLTAGSNGMIYVALGQSIRYDTIFDPIVPGMPPRVSELLPVIMEGGVFEYNGLYPHLPFPERFRKTVIPEQSMDIRVDAAGWRDETEVWFAVDKSCSNGVCVNPYIVRYGTTGAYKTDLITEGNSPIPFTTKNYLTVRSIFTDSEGRTYVGLSDGLGIAVQDKVKHWEMVTPANSGLPVGAAINFNAITEIEGQIWIGTTLGLLIYNGTGSVTNCNSYTLYTVANGLPGNNVTDVAYDEFNQKIWITTTNGICRSEKDGGIHGIVLLNGIIGEKTSPTQLFSSRIWSPVSKTPLKATVKIFDSNNNQIDLFTLDGTGKFNWRGGKRGEVYRVVISHPNSKAVYEYGNLKYNSNLGEINMVAEELIADFKEFEIDLASGLIEKSLSSDQLVYNIGFDTSGAGRAYKAFQDTIKSNHNKKVENLFLYGLALKTIKGVSRQSALLSNEMVESMFYAIESLLNISKTNSRFHKNSLIGKDDMIELAFDMKRAAAALGEVLRTELYKTSATLTLDQKDIFDKYAAFMVGAIEPAFELLKKGDYVDLDEIIKILTTEFTLETKSWNYYELCQQKHKGLIKQLAESCFQVKSGKLYNPAFRRLWQLPTPEPKSLFTNIIDVADVKSEEIKQLREFSKAANATNSQENIISLLDQNYTIAQLEAKTEELAKLVHDVQMDYLIKASVLAVNTGIAFADSSLKVVGETGFPAIAANRAPSPSAERHAPTPAPGDLNLTYVSKPIILQSAFIPHNATTLQAQELLFKEKLIAVKALHTQPFNLVAYNNKCRELRYQDSVYTAEMGRTLNNLWPSVPAIISKDPGFKSRLHLVIDSFIAGQYQLREAYYFRNIAYRLSTNKPAKHSSLDSLIDRIVLFNDSAVAGIARLFEQVDKLSIEAPASLVQEGLELRFTGQKGAKGRAIYTFVNYGSVPQHQVAFKISTISSGFVLTGNDSLYIDVINPGEAKKLEVAFTAPLKDTAGTYSIKIEAANGQVPFVKGMLFTLPNLNSAIVLSIKSGLWSDPGTWSTGQVPTAISLVTIKHNVTVDINGTCKTLTADSPAQLQVAAGKKLTLTGN